MSELSVYAPQGTHRGVPYRIQIRTWYVQGKYLGNESSFQLCDTGELARKLTGNRYGDWQGPRYFDGAKIINEDLDWVVGNYLRGVELGVYGLDSGSERHLIRLSDWGELCIELGAAALVPVEGALDELTEVA